ncbi:hypothetical protein G7046_g1989 [Stylonectria norvegica]|nr:hypothetical protein G7046_g1989 [Stylonectria norvegica]
MLSRNTFFSLLLASSASALKVPANVRKLYNDLKSSGTCDNKLATGFFNNYSDDGTTSYCGDHLDDYGIIYLQGNDGKLSNMDPDCDGEQGGSHDDGRCGGSTTTQERTSVRSLIESYDVGIDDLNPHEHSYVVFGNEGDTAGWRTFEPMEYGIQSASIMAVVCGDKMFYGVWGDANGDDSEKPSVGEVSISLATACYGKKMSAGDGDGTSHNAADVLYIAFAGYDAVPGADGADWAAGNFNDFHASLVPLGNKLVSRIGAKTPSGGYGTELGDCSWIGHCKDAPCDSSGDCDGDLTCTNGKCAAR